MLEHGFEGVAVGWLRSSFGCDLIGQHDLSGYGYSQTGEIKDRNSNYDKCDK